MSVVYQEGVGFGGFAAVFATAGSTFCERFNPTFPTKKITRPDVLGGDNAALGAGFALITDFSSASMTIQTTVTGVTLTSQGTPVIVLRGDYFTDPIPGQGHTWAVESVEPAFDMGIYWTQQIRVAKTTAS